MKKSCHSNSIPHLLISCWEKLRCANHTILRGEIIEWGATISSEWDGELMRWWLPIRWLHHVRQCDNPTKVFLLFHLLFSHKVALILQLSDCDIIKSSCMCIIMLNLQVRIPQNMHETIWKHNLFEYIF